MFRVEANPVKNRIVIFLEGMMSVEDVKRNGAQIARAAAGLKPGFDCITDISGLKPSSPKAAEEIAGIQRMMAKQGMRHVVRVVGSVIAGLQLERTSKQLSYDVRTAPTEAAAHALLDAW